VILRAAPAISEAGTSRLSMSTPSILEVSSFTAASPRALTEAKICATASAGTSVPKSAFSLSLRRGEGSGGTKPAWRARALARGEACYGLHFHPAQAARRASRK